MPKDISSAQKTTYLQTLRDTGNATLAAEVAGVSRDWAYKKREQDARFARLFREMVAVARERLKAAAQTSNPLPSADIPSIQMDRRSLQVRSAPPSPHRGE